MPFTSSWSDADKERLKTLHQEGKSIPEAAEILGKTYDSVRHKSLYLGLIFRRLDQFPAPHQKWWRSENRLETLKQMFAEGLPTAEIGRRMGATKNAIIGKLTRMGHFIPPPQEPRHYPIDDLYDQEGANGRRCRWPHGHPNEPNFHFCCAPAETFLPYCGKHTAIAYLKAPSSQE